MRCEGAGSQGPGVRGRIITPGRLWHCGIAFALCICICIYSPLFAQPVEQPPGLTLPTPPGETPHQPSEPPTGYEPTPTPTVDVTGGVSMPVAENILRLDADFWRVEFEEGEAVQVIARDNVRATYRDFTVTSSEAVADLRTEIATFTGNVVFSLPGQDIGGSRLSVNLRTRDWEFKSAQSVLRPEYFPELLRAPVFLSGEVVTGRSDEIVTIRDGGFTTCNLENPHYLLDAGTATIWPDRKLVARDTTFSALGKRIFRIPRLAIPLNQISERQNLTPRVGQTQEEGLFLKAAYSFAATLNNSGNLKLDLMSKKGIGIGAEDNYRIGKGSGNAYIYQLSDRNRNLSTLTGRLQHEHQLGTVKANFTSDYRSNSFQYAPGSTSLGNQLMLTRSRQGVSTSLGIRQSTDTGFGRFSMLTSNFQHNQVFDSNRSAGIGLDYFRSENPLTIDGQSVDLANSQLVSRLDYRQRSTAYDWALRMNKINDLSNEAFISQSGTRFTGTERLPEFSLATSSERLKKTLPFGLPARLDLAVGRYREDLGRTETERAVVDLESPPRVYKLADKLNLLTGAGFKQYAYGNNTAQYSIDATAEITREIGEQSSASIAYRYLRPRGFTPFRFDFIGRYNILDARLDYRETSKLRFSLATGYNFEQDDFPWQDITARIVYQPSDRYLLYTSTGYDVNRSEWRALINQVRVRLPNDFKLDVGSRYDFRQNKFASIKTQLDTPVGNKWRLRAQTGYNGFTKNFDYRTFQLIRDLHCWELSLQYVDQTGFWQEKGFRLNLRIKAFPIFDSFGVGQFGQALDTSVGEVL